VCPLGQPRQHLLVAASGTLRIADGVVGDHEEPGDQGAVDDTDVPPSSPCLQENYRGDVFSIFLGAQDTEAVSEDAQVMPVEDLPERQGIPSIALRHSSSSVLIPDSVRSPGWVPSSPRDAERTGNRPTRPLDVHTDPLADCAPPTVLSRAWGTTRTPTGISAFTRPLILGWSPFPFCGEWVSPGA
jgi:hypothetical protein